MEKSHKWNHLLTTDFIRPSSCVELAWGEICVNCSNLRLSYALITTNCCKKVSLESELSNQPGGLAIIRFLKRRSPWGSRLRWEWGWDNAFPLQRDSAPVSRERAAGVERHTSSLNPSSLNPSLFQAHPVSFCRLVVLAATPQSALWNLWYSDFAPWLQRCSFSHHFANSSTTP